MSTLGLYIFLFKKNVGNIINTTYSKETLKNTNCFVIVTYQKEADLILRFFTSRIIIRLCINFGNILYQSNILGFCLFPIVLNPNLGGFCPIKRYNIHLPGINVTKNVIYTVCQVLHPYLVLSFRKDT